MNIEIFSEAMNEIDEKYLQEALQYRKKPIRHSVVKWGAAAACLALLLALGHLFFPFPGDMTVSAYAYGTNEEITAAGLTLLTGAISDSGEMTGKPLTFYLSGEDIATVRFSCKNQALSFMDWTKEWPEYGKAGNFTVVYGEDESQYYYLVIDWEPDTLIRELTDNPDSAIDSLPEEMRSDLIVLEVTFLNGETATKAIRISLLDDGTFFASFDDYKVSDEDAFVRRPDSNDIPRSALSAEETQVSEIADAPPETQEAQSQISGSMTEEILSAAEEAARAYYAGTVLEVVSMELKSQTEDTILFSVSVKKGGVVQEPERSITLQLVQGTWTVVNEGY